MFTYRFWVLPLMALGMLQACDKEYEPSLLDDPQILALRATAEEGNELGGPYTVHALTHNIDSLTWKACGAPWLPTADGVECPTPVWELPQGDTPLSARMNLDDTPIPDDIKSAIEVLYVRADAPSAEVVPAVLRVYFKTAINNPPMNGLTLDGVAPGDWAINADKTVEVAPQWSDGFDGKDTVTTYFTSSGAFDPWRTLDGKDSTLSLDSFDAAVQVYVITRLEDKGTTWSQVELAP